MCSFQMWDFGPQKHWGHKQLSQELHSCIPDSPPPAPCTTPQCLLLGSSRANLIVVEQTASLEHSSVDAQKAGLDFQFGEHSPTPLDVGRAWLVVSLEAPNLCRRELLLKSESKLSVKCICKKTTMKNKQCSGGKNSFIYNIDNFSVPNLY